MKATTTILTALAYGTGILALCSAAMPASEVAEFDRIRQVHAGNANKLFENVLLSKKAAPLQRGFAQLWLTRDLKEGNRLLREAHQAIIKQGGGENAMTAEIASSEQVKWQMRTWNRIYQLFSQAMVNTPCRNSSTFMILAKIPCCAPTWRSSSI